jgi:hypothetical protein
MFEKASSDAVQTLVLIVSLTLAYIIIWGTLLIYNFKKGTIKK